MVLKKVLRVFGWVLLIIWFAPALSWYVIVLKRRGIEALIVNKEFILMGLIAVSMLQTIYTFVIFNLIKLVIDLIALYQNPVIINTLNF